jgi:hypothetical protein
MAINLVTVSKNLRYGNGFRVLHLLTLGLIVLRMNLPLNINSTWVKLKFLHINKYLCISKDSLAYGLIHGVVLLSCCELDFKLAHVCSKLIR